MFYVENERAVIKAEFRDKDGNLYDPTSVDSVKIYNNIGTLIDEILTIDITKESTGIYYITYEIPTNPEYGWWRADFFGTTDSENDIIEIQFEVIKYKKLYTSTDRVYAKAGITSDVISRDDVREKIRDAMADIDSEMQRQFDATQNINEWHNIHPADSYVTVNTIFTDYRPIQQVISLDDYNDGVLQQSFDSGLISGCLLANALKVTTNAHAADITMHSSADTDNYPITTANARDWTTLKALTATLLIAYNAHDIDSEKISGWTYHIAKESSDHSINHGTSVPVDIDEAVIKLNNLRDKYNKHDKDNTCHTLASLHEETTALAKFDFLVDKKIGQIILISEKGFRYGNKTVHIQYEYGYEQVPRLISRLCTILAAKAILIEQVGGTYETPSTYSVAGLSVSIGQAYVNIRGAIDVLVKEEAEVRKALGKLRTNVLVI